MAKQKKAPKPKALPPKGFRDYFGADVSERAEMLRRIADVYHLYGFEQLESSAVETVEALGKFLPDVDRPNEGVFAWQEDDDWLALRYDLTAPWRGSMPNTAMSCPAPIAALPWGRFGAMKNRGLVGFVSFINVMRIRSDRPAWPLMQRFARCFLIRWKKWALPAAITSSG